MKERRKNGAVNIAGLHGLRTLHSTGRRSIPRGNQDSTFLDLYMLGKERERLEKESSIVERRKTIIQRRLADIEKESRKLQAAEAGQLTAGGRARRKSLPATGAPQGVPKWQRMALQY
ncbi:MAG: hypothetical protein WC632_06245 [Candidatus Margulisiibacteriota bacterium]